MRELIARIKIVLKRKSNIEDINTLECGNLKLNTNVKIKSVRGLGYKIELEEKWKEEKIWNLQEKY